MSGAWKNHQAEKVTLVFDALLTSTVISGRHQAETSTGPVPNSPYGLYGSIATLNLNATGMQQNKPGQQQPASMSAFSRKVTSFCYCVSSSLQACVSSSLQACRLSREK